MLTSQDVSTRIRPHVEDQSITGKKSEDTDDLANIGLHVLHVEAAQAKETEDTRTCAFSAEFNLVWKNRLVLSRLIADLSDTERSSSHPCTREPSKVALPLNGFGHEQQLACPMGPLQSDIEAERR